MSSIPKAFPLLLDWAELARNNQVPDARFINQVGNYQNFINAYRRKEVFSSLLSNYSGGAGPNVVWRGYFHSGHAALSLTFDYVLSPAGHPANDPYVTMALTKVGGSTQSLDHHWGGAQGGASRAPNKDNASQRTFAIDADADYSWTFSATGEALPLTLTCFERGRVVLDNSINYFLGPSYGYSEIYDANRQRISEGLSKLWRHNGAHIVAWGRGSATSPTITGATWTNIMDATTAVASTSAGYLLGGGLLAPYCRQSQTAPKVVMAVYGSVSGGVGTGEVRLQTDAGTTLCSVIGINGTPGWFTTPQTLAAVSGFTKCDPQFRMNGAGTLSLEAISLYLYET